MPNVQKTKPLSITHKELAKELIEIVGRPNFTAADVTRGSIKAGLWQCSINKEHPPYLASVKDRSRGRGCPYCSGRKVCMANCLATLSPGVSVDWDYEANRDITPLVVGPGSECKAHWQCNECDYKWTTRVYARTGTNNHRSGCPYCTRRGWKLDLFRHWAFNNFNLIANAKAKDRYDMFLQAGLVRSISEPRVIVEAFLGINGSLSINEFYKFAHNEPSSAITRLLNLYNPRKFGNRPGFTKTQRRAIFERDNYTCQNPYCNECGIPDKHSFHVDHRKPWSKGGSHEVDNWFTLCQSCNTSKCDQDWGMFLKKCANGAVAHLAE